MNWFVLVGVFIALFALLNPPYPEYDNRRELTRNVVFVVVFALGPALLIGYGLR